MTDSKRTTIRSRSRKALAIASVLAMSLGSYLIAQASGPNFNDTSNLAVSSQNASFTGNFGIGTTTPVNGTAIMNGNVGIGTWSPTAALEIIGLIKSSNSIQLAGSGDSYFNGNLGIGTSTAGRALEVSGTARMTGFEMPTGASSGYVLTSDVSGVGSWAAASGGASGWTDGGTNVYNTTTTDNVAIGTTTPVSKLTVKGGVGIGTITPYSTIAPPANGMTVNGNVGIGTWNPFSLLQVAGTIRADAIAGYSAADSNTNISISSDQIFFTIDGLGRGEWTNTYIDVPPQIRFDTDNSVGITYAGTDMISFYTADVDRLLINANGNVGIGTASPVGALTVMNGNVGIGTWSPTQRLQVVGTVSATAFVGDGSGLTGISAGGWTDGGTNVFTSTTTDNVGIGTTTPTAALLVQNAGTQSSFRVNDAVLDGSPFIIDSAGNVGIGTSTPGYHFRVYDTGNDLVVGYFQNAGGFAEINISNSTNAIKAGVDATTGWYTVEGNLPLTLGTNSTEKMRITSSGNVGIGTTTPVGGLTVMNGNVGIGTNVPKALVHIRAGGLSEQTLHPGSGGSAISYNTFYNGSNDKYLTSESAFSVFHDLSNDALRIMAAAVGTAGNNATYSDSMLFWSDGKVGIGGITGLAGMSSLLNVYSSSGAIAALKGVGDGTDFSALNLWSDEGTDLSWEMSHTQNPANTLAFNYYNGTTWSTKLTINNSGNVGVGTTTPVGGLTVLSGNVGIGTWSPTSRLQVIGTVNATAFVGDGSGLTGISAGGWTDGGTNVYTSTTTDNVGIGTTTPTAALLVENAGTQTSFRVNDAVADPSPFIIDAAGNVGVGTSGPLALVHVQETYTGGNVAHNMLYNYYSVQPSVDIDTSSYQYGNKTEMWFSGANDIGPWGSSAIYGLAYSNMDAAATSANVTGVRGSALQNGDGFTTDMTGVYAEATKANIGGVGNMFGVYSVATNQNTTNSVLGLYAGSFNAISTGSVASNSMGGVTASITVAAGATVVAAKGISTDVTNSGTITDAYGLYVGSVQGTNKWSMYASDAAAPSYFAGNVGLGTTAPVGALTVMSGNVGIGTWSPTQRLQVVGTVSATAFVGDGSGLTGISAGGWTDGGTNVYTSTTTDNVAIGTTTPVGKLTIKGGVGIGTITPYTSIAPPANGMIVDGNVGIGTWAVNSGKLIVMGGNVGIGTITPVGALTVMNGNVGIGTYSPVSLFDVGPFGGISGAGALPAYQASVNQQSATASDETLLLTNGGGLGRASSIQFRGSTSVSSNVFSTGRVVSGASGAGYATSYLTLGSASANNAFNNEMTLINGNVGIGTSVPVGGLTVMNGNVGIGTWSPRAKLEVIGSVLATSFYGDGSNLTNISSGGWNDGGTNVFTVTTTDNVAIGTTTPVNKLSVRGNVGIGSTVPYPTISAPLNGMVVEGNVGIGTWNPRTKLQVEISDTNGDSVLEAMRVVHTDNSGNGNDGIGVSLAFYNEDDAGRTRESADIISVLDASTDNAINASLRFHTMGPSAGAGVTAATEKMRLDATGNLGIGDTGPDAALEVVGAMMISGAAANNGERLIVTTAGNVGIGTNIPKSRFVVYGGVGIGTTGGTAFIATTAPAGGLIVQNSVGIGTTTPVGALTVMNGNVGIGTWSPRANLEVIGSVLATSFYGDGSNLTGISAGGWTDGGANVYTSVTTDNVGIGTTTPASTLTIAGNIGIGTYAAYRTIAGPNNGMILEGNVGIGTWNPSQKLQVVGTVSATAFVGDGSGLTGISAGGWTDGGTNVYATTTSDNVGVGLTNPSAKLEIYNSSAAYAGNISSMWNIATDPVSNANVLYASSRPTYTSNTALTAYVNNAEFYPLIANGVTASGTQAGYFGRVTRNEIAGDANGILTWGIAGQFEYGHGNFAGITPSTTNAAGIYIQPKYQTGTIANMYDIFIASDTTGGTATNRYGFYQSTANKNYFAGNVGLGTTTPVGAFTVMNGKVGIGTWSPSHSFEVMNSGVITPGDEFTYPFAVGIAGGRKVVIGSDLNHPYIQSTSLRPLQINAMGNDLLLNSGGGNIAIGTVSPIGKLTVIGNVGIGTITPYRTITPPANGMIVDGNVGIGTWAANSGKLIVMGGNVGIGTTDPRTVLEVLTESITNRGFTLSLFATSSVGNAIYIKKSRGTVNAPTVVSNADYIGGIVSQPRSSTTFVTSTAGMLFYVNGTPAAGSVPTDLLLFTESAGASNPYTDTTTNKFLLSSGGNVGIGTTTPVGALTVMNGNVGLGTWSPRARLEINNTVSYSSIYDNGNSGTSITIDWRRANIQKVTLTGNCTFTFTAPGGIAKVMLQLVQGGGGGFTASWPGTVKWPAASAPTLTAAAGSVDFVTCLYDGTNYYCTSSLDLR